MYVLFFRNTLTVGFPGTELPSKSYTPPAKVVIRHVARHVEPAVAANGVSSHGVVMQILRSIECPQAKRFAAGRAIVQIAKVKVGADRQRPGAVTASGREVVDSRCRLPGPAGGVCGIGPVAEKVPHHAAAAGAIRPAPGHVPVNGPAAGTSRLVSVARRIASCTRERQSAAASQRRTQRRNSRTERPATRSKQDADTETFMSFIL